MAANYEIGAYGGYCDYNKEDTDLFGGYIMKP
jgi:hypothetical protein